MRFYAHMQKAKNLAIETFIEKQPSFPLFSLKQDE